MGRRRPFIIGGSVLVCLSMLCVGYAKEIGSLWSDNDDTVCLLFFLLDLNSSKNRVNHLAFLFS